MGNPPRVLIEHGTGDESMRLVNGSRMPLADAHTDRSPPEIDVSVEGAAVNILRCATFCLERACVLLDVLVVFPCDLEIEVHIRVCSAGRHDASSQYACGLRASSY